MPRIKSRIREKQRNYASYDFSPAQNDLLRAFFDLAQEFDAAEDFYLVCVAALSEFLGLDSRLYLHDSEQKKLILVCESQNGLPPEPVPAPAYVYLYPSSYESEDSLLVPIHRKPSSEGGGHGLRNLQLIGMLEVYPLKVISGSDRFFLRKYTNRIGYNLDNRLIAQENIRHLQFINNLVMDIEHNVITPNIYFKHLFNQLKARINGLAELEKSLGGLPANQAAARIAALRFDFVEVHRKLAEHHANYSLFLESLFRRDHFAQGRFVLRLRKCSIDREIVLPQLDHFLSRFGVRGITVEKPRDMGAEELFLWVDIGLLSQVYANLFSNALKYTGRVIRSNGEERKAVAYGREFLSDYFGPGRGAVKFNVFSTGGHLPEAEVKTLFTEGFRGERSINEPGTGHGLAFVKQVVEIHGGVVGYEATEEGNNFYFILPLSDPGNLPGEQN